MALTEKERDRIELDARLDHQDDTSRKYHGDGVVDVVFAVSDLLEGTQSTTAHAAEKNGYYNEVRESLDKRK